MQQTNVFFRTYSAIKETRIRQLFFFLLILHLFFFASACGLTVPLGVPTAAPPDRIHPDLREYVSDFMQECYARGLKEVCERNFKKLSTVTISSKEFFDGPGKLGICTEVVDDQKLVWLHIRLKEDFFYKNGKLVNEPALRGTTYHELGHCILRRDHTSKDEIGIMSPHVLRPEYYNGLSWHTLLASFFLDSYLSLRVAGQLGQPSAAGNSGIKREYPNLGFTASYAANASNEGLEDNEENTHAGKEPETPLANWQCGGLEAGKEYFP